MSQNASKRLWLLGFIACDNFPFIQALLAVQGNSPLYLCPFPAANACHNCSKLIAIVGLQFVWLSAKTFAPDFRIADILTVNHTFRTCGIVRFTYVVAPLIDVHIIPMFRGAAVRGIPRLTPAAHRPPSLPAARLRLPLSGRLRGTAFRRSRRLPLPQPISGRVHIQKVPGLYHTS